MTRNAAVIAKFVIALIAQSCAGWALAEECQRPSNVSFAPGKLTTDRQYAGQQVAVQAERIARHFT